ncbi:AMP-binding protein [Sphingomonas flavalba]|uniref:AMP-binding protein n=1 Tax=Sphingomonas flavalba TaxID=2559804 RepID=UPI0039E0DD9A
MRRAGLAFPGAAAVAVHDRIIYDYATIARRVATLAGALRGRHGLVPGDRVGILAKNCVEYLEILYACWHAGLIVVPINAKLHPGEVRFIAENSEMKLCFVSEGLGGAEAGEAVQWVTIGGEAYLPLLDGPEVALEPRLPDDDAWIFYTSGTTGRPKGATLTHRNLLAMCFCYFTDVDPVSPWSAILHAAPMSHGSGLYALPHVMQASCNVIPESGGFDVDEVYRLIEAWPGLVFFAAPTMVKRLLDDGGERDTRNLKAIIYGGGPMYLEHCLAGLERFGPKLTQLYGQGETPMTITALNARHHAQSDHPQWRARLASVGVAQSAVEVRTVDEAGAPTAPGEVGEVAVRGDSVMRGYWRDSKATEDAIRDGWLHTGDFGVFDEDGFLTLKDRSKDLIISGGTNIYPREIEEILLTHPAISEVAVIGRQNEEWGEEVVAFVVGADVDASALDALCQQHIARFKRPRHYHFVTSLPKNSYGKVLKTDLRRIDAELVAASA